MTTTQHPKDGDPCAVCFETMEHGHPNLAPRYSDKFGDYVCAWCANGGMNDGDMVDRLMRIITTPGEEMTDYQVLQACRNLLNEYANRENK